jgi:hypothetical protein
LILLVLKIKENVMKKKTIFSIVSLLIGVNSSIVSYADESKQICNEKMWLCITPMVNTKSNLSTGKHLTDVVNTSIGAKFSNPKSKFFVEMHGSIVPFLKYDSVIDDAKLTAEERGDLAHSAVDAKLAAGAKQYVSGQLAAAGVTTSNPMYTPLFKQYYGVALTQITATKGQPYYNAIAEHQAAGIAEVERRAPKIRNQDSIQQVVLGYDDGTLFFEVGKFKAGANGPIYGTSEMGKYTADRPVTDELQTLGQARFNTTIGRRDFQISNKVKVTLVGFVGKEGRVFLSAVQDTTNALKMNKEDFDRDAKLFGLDAGGGSIKVDIDGTGDSFTVTGIEGPYGPTIGTEARIQITPQLIGHIAYVYANKLGAKGNNIRGQIDYHLGEKFGSEWVVAFYGEKSNVQHYEELPIEIDSKSGLVDSSKFGAALTGSKKKMAGFEGVDGSATLDLGYKTDGSVNDAQNFITHEAVGPDIVDGGFVGSLSFSLQY